MARIFISHSRKDDDFTRDLVERLQSAGFDVWVDFEDIQSGEDWVEKIEQGILACDAFVVVMSKAARGSRWVRREALMAMELHKPIHIALIDPIPLPLHLIDRQFIRFMDDPDHAAQRLITALRQASASEPYETPEVDPNEDNYFRYLSSLPGGEANTLVARDLYRWARQQADRVDFSGEVTPGFHARLDLGGDDLILFSVWAYARQPAVQLQFQYLADYPPYDDPRLRRSTLHSINRLLPPEDHLVDDKADRRPTIPLAALDNAARLETFKDIVGEIINTLRGQ